MSNEKHMKQFSSEIGKLMADNKWETAEKRLRKELNKNQGEYWIITSLANVLYEQKKYKEALTYGKAAMKIASDDPLVIYDYAPILKMNGRIREAIKFWLKIYEMDIDVLAYGEYGEGMRWAKSMKNNVCFHLAIAYKDLKNYKSFKKFLELNLRNRERGVYASYPKSTAIKIYNQYFGNM